MAVGGSVPVHGVGVQECRCFCASVLQLSRALVNDKTCSRSGRRMAECELAAGLIPFRGCLEEHYKRLLPTIKISSGHGVSTVLM